MVESHMHHFDHIDGIKLNDSFEKTKTGRT